MGLFAQDYEGQIIKRTANEIKMEIGATRVAEGRALLKAKQYREELKELEKELKELEA